MKRSSFLIVFSFLVATTSAVDVEAQFPVPGEDPIVSAPIAQPRLTDSIPSASDMVSSDPSVSQIRQARAMARTKARIERLERNLWYGYEPLRPNWNSIPMMSSRYPTQGRIIVPVYLYP